MLQALYFCAPFREAVLEWYRTPNPHSKVKNDDDSMLMSVAEAFEHINSNKKKIGVYGIYVCMYTYVYMYTCIYIYIHMYIYVYDMYVCI